MSNNNRASARFFQVLLKGEIPFILLSILIFLYLLIHLFTLHLHPFVHSDEAWLAVLSRAMIVERNPAAVEEIFRLTPRYPHALKTLYHMVQAPFLAISWSVYSARLPSLIAGIFSLVFITRIAFSLGMGKYLRFVPVLFMALDPQFWYAAHFGRQEMLLTALFLFSWDLKCKNHPSWIVALPLSAAIFVHPNAFIIAIPMGVLYLIEMLDSFCKSGIKRTGKIKDIVFFMVVSAAFASAAVGFSYLMDSDFLNHYLRFGDSVGAGDSLLIKLLGFPVFLEKMWRGNAGTYYLADVRPMFVIGSLGFLLLLLSLVHSLNRKTALSVLSVPLSLALGMVLVGKYGPPTIIFLMPPAYLLFAYSLNKLKLFQKKRFYKAALKPSLPLIVILAAAILSWTTLMEVSHSLHKPSYTSYRGFLKENISKEGRVLANLNTAFAFDYNRLVIWRDLANLRADEDSLNKFLQKNDVRWVILTDELELVYESRPVWNALYGNPFWYPQLVGIIEDEGVEAAAGIFPDYAMRIVPYMNRKPWASVIYRIQQ
ncbi:MAG: hypothetical protein KAH21_06350 [Spirochaetaceae bacterium]|nr:hypothetical protein [Spirochaetaceae bacterium]